MLSIKNLAHIVNAKNISEINANLSFADKIFTSVSTDNRTCKDNALFVAIKGERFDGHEFIAHNSCVAIVNRRILTIPNSVVQIIVEDTLIALQKLANYWRNLFSIPIVAVVGSNGKTSVKEMIATIFASNVGAECVCSTSGNFNNDIGLPLSILKLNSGHKLAVFEIGINHPKETKLLASILQPTIAIINNAQREHQEFMVDIDTVALEHSYLLDETKYLKHAVLPIDSQFYNIWEQKCIANNIEIYGFGLHNIEKITASNNNSNIKYALGILKYDALNKLDISYGFDCTLHVDPQQYHKQIKLKVLGVHNILNALAAMSVASCAGVDVADITMGIQSFEAVKGRLQLSSITVNGTKINLINDTYNANPDSVKAAIDVLGNFSGDSMLVLGDMGEVGTNGKAYHQEVGNYAIDKINTMFTLGDISRSSSEYFYANNANIGINLNNRHFENSNINNLFTAIDDCIMYNSNIKNILIKGSRFMKTERIIEHLQSKFA
jgi:UDP-N-acetylmuramoyl-tripeptide--D-alanyl-D-alanine ligase